MYIYDGYYSANFDLMQTNEELKSMFLEHFEELNRAYIYDYYNYDPFGLKLNNHNLFSLLHLLFAEKTGSDSDYPDTLATRDVPKNRKYYLFSAHDTTLTGLLAGLGIWDAPSTSFASSIIIELHQDEEEENKYYVKLIYDDNALIIPGPCQVDFLCDVNDFLDYLSTQMLPKGETYENACMTYDQTKSHLLKKIVGIACIVVAIAVLGLIILYCCKYRNVEDQSEGVPQKAESELALMKNQN